MGGSSANIAYATPWGMMTTPTVIPANKSLRSSEHEYLGPQVRIGMRCHADAQPRSTLEHCDDPWPSMSSVETLSLGSLWHISRHRRKAETLAWSVVDHRGNFCASDASVATCVPPWRSSGSGTFSNSRVVHDLLLAIRARSVSSSSGLKEEAITTFRISWLPYRYDVVGFILLLVLFGIF